MPRLINKYLVFWGSCCVCLQVIKWGYKFHPNCWHTSVTLHDVTPQKIIILHVNLISYRCVCDVNVPAVQLVYWFTSIPVELQLYCCHVNFTFMCAADLECILGFEIGGCQVPSKYEFTFKKINIFRKLSCYLPSSNRWGCRRVALPILDLGARRGWVLSAMSGCSTFRRPSSYCTGGWVGMGPTWMGPVVLALSRVRSSDYWAHSESQYWLLCLGCQLTYG